jgi:hypothetical protein
VRGGRESRMTNKECRRRNLGGRSDSSYFDILHSLFDSRHSIPQRGSGRDARGAARGWRPAEKQTGPASREGRRPIGLLPLPAPGVRCPTNSRSCRSAGAPTALRNTSIPVAD